MREPAFDSLAEPEIPDESAPGGREPESSECDELRYSLSKGNGTNNYPAE